jgi:hypothetical protein
MPHKCRSSLALDKRLSGLFAYRHTIAYGLLIGKSVEAVSIKKVCVRLLGAWSKTVTMPMHWIHAKRTGDGPICRKVTCTTNLEIEQRSIKCSRWRTDVPRYYKGKTCIESPPGGVKLHGNIYNKDLRCDQHLGIQITARKCQICAERSQCRHLKISPTFSSPEL